MIQRGCVGVLSNHGVLSKGGVGVLAITAYSLMRGRVLANHGTQTKWVPVLANHGIQTNEGRVLANHGV